MTSQRPRERQITARCINHAQPRDGILGSNRAIQGEGSRGRHCKISSGRYGASQLETVQLGSEENIKRAGLPGIHFGLEVARSIGESPSVRDCCAILGCLNAQTIQNNGNGDHFRDILYPTWLLTIWHGAASPDGTVDGGCRRVHELLDIIKA